MVVFTKSIVLVDGSLTKSSVLADDSVTGSVGVV